MSTDTSYLSSTVPTVPDGSTTLLCPKLFWMNSDLISLFLEGTDGVYFQYGNAFSTVSFS